MKCSSCSNWITERKTVYDDGSEIINYASPKGEGHCDILNVDTTPDFGCLSFKEGNNIIINHKTGAPWQYWEYKPCPECNGRGSYSDRNGHCNRCVGTGNVRYYDDGYIGDEKTKKHPKESKMVVEEVQLKKIESGKSGVL